MYPAMVPTMPGKKPVKVGRGRPKAPEPLLAIGALKGRKAFAEWAERLFDHNRVNASTGLEFALVAWAKSTGFTEEAPKRM